MKQAKVTKKPGTISKGWIPNWLLWPVKRSVRTFRVYVVEPAEYKPENHANIFNAALTNLVMPERPYLVDRYSDISNYSETADPFDLVTFPEAFLPQEDMISMFSYISDVDTLGCVHVGIRPSRDGAHLFSANDLYKLVDDLIKISDIEINDMNHFSSWLGSQSSNEMFNVGCLFTIDVHQKIRICLHPKLVRSKFESSPFHKDNMTEGNLISLVTLQPEDKSLLSVTLQPLICSDSLFIDTDRPNGRPLEALNAHANCFPEPPPDHVDIISVAACTPQQELTLTNGAKYRQWHQEFRKAFERTASDLGLTRHNYSSFVLSNYEVMPMGDPGGLSGIFIPIPLHDETHASYVNLSSWGRPKNSGNSDNRWSSLDDDLGRDKWSSYLGYIVSLDPYKSRDSNSAWMLGFTINRLPRHSTHIRFANNISNFQLRTAVYDTYSRRLAFRREEL